MLKFLKRSAIILGILLAIGTAITTTIVFLELQKLPKIEAARLNTFGNSQITDKNGTVIWRETALISQPMTYEQIPELYRDALIATEDKDFWKNHGFSWKGLANALIGTVRSQINKNYDARGGSTIEQQLIKKHLLRTWNIDINIHT